MKKYKFECGCEFEVLEDSIKDCDSLPPVFIDYYNINMDCSKTWDLIQNGQTKGIFQLETNLGKKWAKDVLPQDIEELAALISVMRPGVLRAMVDIESEDEDEKKQISMAKLYCNRKNLGEEVTYLHEALKPILEETQGILLYQEQAIRIAQDIAGFTEEEADTLRRAIGKKKADVMAQVQQDFIKGCDKTNIVPEQDSEQIFGWIKESQRYSFNKSHAVEYSEVGYWSAYAKAHFPLHFFTSWLFYAHEKIKPQEEVQKLISDAKTFDVSVHPPNLQQIHNGDLGHFSMKDGIIYFGIEDIKKIGKSHVNKVFNGVNIVEKQLNRTIDKWTWYEFLTLFSDYTSTTVVNNLIAAGATDYMGKSRNNKIHEYNEWKNLTIKEKEWIKENCDTNTTLLESIQNMYDFRQKLSTNRKGKVLDIIKNIKNSKFSLNDDAYFITRNEQELLGIPLTCSKLDACPNKIVPDTTCQELLDGKSGKFLIRVEIIGVNEYIIKKGKQKGRKMLFLEVEDDTAVLDSVVVFPDSIVGNEPWLINGSTVLLRGERDNKYNKDSFIVENVIPI